MSDYRKRLSGAEYRKRKTEKSSKQENLLNKIPKISNFMTRSEKLVSDDQQESGSSDVSILIHLQVFFFFKYNSKKNSKIISHKLNFLKKFLNIKN